MICSLTQCGRLFWVVYSSPFFFPAAMALLHWQGKNHWRSRCAAGPASSELKVLPDLSKRLVCVPRLRQCSN